MLIAAAVIVLGVVLTALLPELPLRAVSGIQGRAAEDAEAATTAEAPAAAAEAPAAAAEAPAAAAEAPAAAAEAPAAEAPAAEAPAAAAVAPGTAAADDDDAPRGTRLKRSRG